MNRLHLTAVFGLVVVIRTLTADTLSGDDHWALWTASLFLHGDRPFRDFVDLGAPLFWAVSALAQAAVGYRVIGEVLLATTMMAAAAAISFHLARQASRSLAVAAGTTALVVLFLADIEVYSYAKIFFYPLGMWLCWRYIDRPTLPRAIVLAVGVAVAFGYRHDHGAYLGLGATMAIVARHWAEGPRRVILGGLQFGLALVLLLSPFLLFVQVNEGVVPYFRDRIQNAQRMDETARRTVWFDVDASAPSGWFPVAPPPPARVQVDWRPDVTPELRTALAQRYSLTNAVSPYRQLHEYRLTDVSEGTLSALLGEQRITQIKGGIPAVISLEWHASLTDRRRAELENGYHLANPRSDPSGPSGRAILYDMQDVSPANRRVLSAEPFLVRSSGVRLASLNTIESPPRAGDPVFVEWDERLSDSARVDLERTYGLEDATPGRSRWEYALTDVSRANIQRIVEDPHVTDTGLIDRSAYRPSEEPWWVPLQRAVPLLRMRGVAPQHLHRNNAGVWLYYVSFALPFLVLGALAFDYFRKTPRAGMPHESAKMFAAAVMMAVANMALLRRLGYFADHVDAAAVLGAWVIGRTVGPMRVQWPAGRLAAAATYALLLVSVCASIAWARPLGILRDTGLPNGIGAAWEKGAHIFAVYASSPPIDAYAPPGSLGDKGLLRYIYECTRPDDRVWILSDLLTFPYYSERRIVGHVFWDRQFMTTPVYQRQIIEKVDKEAVPLIVSAGESRPLAYLEPYELLHQYAAKRYTNHYTILAEGRVFRVLTDNRRQPTGTYERLGLPCFK